MRRFLLGNEAVARGALEAGCRLATSYPGTPASEILPAFARWAEEEGIKVDARWAINEKVAFEIALAASYMGVRSMVSMKQVGLNVASDPLMSAAYTGVKGGFVVISVDDPGPYSSQTEQDSRYLATLAKVPVLDPSSPGAAREAVKRAFVLSEEYGIPVMVRPVLRVAHSRQDVELGDVSCHDLEVDFPRDPSRWAATPVFRYMLHRKLNGRLAAIAREEAKRLEAKLDGLKGPRLVLASGALAACVRDVGGDSLLELEMSYPLDKGFLALLLDRFEEVLVVEETYPVIEMQFPCRDKVKGRLSGHLPLEGETTPEMVRTFLAGEKVVAPAREGGGAKPRLCPGCGHRSVFYAMVKVFPQGIYPGDIGCYTLGVNLGAVDTCLCMGASVGQSIGFSRALALGGRERPVVATIGDSTFYHAGIPPLVEAVHSRSPFVLVILDNSTTAMTGGQPTPGFPQSNGREGVPVPLAQLVRGCGVRFLEEVDAYDYPRVEEVLRKAWDYARDHREVAVVLVNSPCVLYTPRERGVLCKVDDDSCVGCGICAEEFECPAITMEGDKARIDPRLCTGCGVCVHVCPVGAIVTD
ncbi:MAG: indolepyruvate oxidoreductase [Aquificota bacterium]|nr:MAG: indolepyruvate oxidoreductase [Aquificota bacterium]